MTTTTIGEDIAAITQRFDAYVTGADEPNSTAAHFINAAVDLMESTPYETTDAQPPLGTYLADDGEEMWVRLDLADRDELRRVVTSSLARVAVLLDVANQEAASAHEVLERLGAKVAVRP